MPGERQCFDVIVVGVGGFGSALLSALARRGVSVLGLERFHLIHQRGSSHGYTRIFRQAIYEKPFYNPWAAGARRGWMELGERCGQEIFVRCGSVDLAPDGHEVLDRVEEGASRVGVRHERLRDAELRSRFPGMGVPAGFSGVYQPDSGLVQPEKAIHVHIEEAIAHGAEIRAHQPVLDWRSGENGIAVKTPDREWRAEQVVFTTGAYTSGLFEGALPIQAERAVLGWFQPVREAERYRSDRFPCWTAEDPGHGHFYGLPIHGYPGFKVGDLRTRGSVNPLEGAAEPDREDEETLRAALARFFPDANGSLLAMMTCYFENTPDRDPIIDEFPGAPGVHVAAGFSGHGFKYVPAVAGFLCDRLCGEPPDPALDFQPFSLSRFGSGKRENHTQMRHQ